MEEVIRNPLVESGGSAARILADRYCRETVIDELWEMVFTNADVVFTSAIELGEVKLAKVAAENVLQGEYGEEIKKKVDAFLKEQKSPQ
jgi:hypothetical protein